MNLVVLNDMEFVLPEADLDFVNVLGRSSDIIQDNGKYKDFDKTFPVRLFKETDSSIAKQLREIAVWLRVSHEYTALTFSEYAEYYYKAFGYTSMTAKDERRDWLDMELTFKCQPFIFRLDGETERAVASGERLKNPEAFPSLPLITFYKTSSTVDSNIYINGKQFRIGKEVPAGTITMDCENGIAYTAGGVNVSKYCFLNTSGYNPITLEPGFNQFSFSNVRDFKIKPRWRTLAV